MNSLQNMKRTRLIPPGAEVIELPDLDVVVIKYTTPKGAPAALAYKGKRAKPAFHHWFKSSMERDDFLNTWKRDREAEHKRNQEFSDRVERERAELLAALVPGAIFYISWGYEQTNINFYEVTGKATKTQVVAHRLVSETVEHSPGAMSGHTTPRKGEYDGKEHKVSWAKKCAQLYQDGQKISCSWYG